MYSLEGNIVVEASDGEEEFTVGKAGFYELIGYLYVYEAALERLYPHKKIALEIGEDEDREEEGEEDEEVIYKDTSSKNLW